ncbi:hypothetical protein M3J09_006889 [Ascochyta lentis]
MLKPLRLYLDTIMLLTSQSSTIPSACHTSTTSSLSKA